MSYFDVSGIEGVRLTKLSSVSDSRGSFIKFEPALQLHGNLDSVAFSINPKAGTIRGIHFQIEPYAEEKIVTCARGSIFDVIIDIRPDSKSLGRIATFELSRSNGMQAYLPKGIAHGFQTLTQDTIVHYCLTSKYSSESSYSINPFSNLGIAWPIHDFLISKKDEAGISLASATQQYAKSLEL
jgi:dTDP-4-dehydrorhamnose 3,5-epimerase